MLGEHLESGIKNVLLLQSDEAIVVTAQEEFDDVLPHGKKTRVGQIPVLVTRITGF